MENQKQRKQSHPRKANNAVTKTEMARMLKDVFAKYQTYGFTMTAEALNALMVNSHLKNLSFELNFNSLSLQECSEVYIRNIESHPMSLFFRTRNSEGEADEEPSP